MAFLARSFLLIALALLALRLTGVVEGKADIVGGGVLLFLGFTAASAARLLVRRLMCPR